MPKFYFDSNSETAEGGYYIVNDEGDYYDHIGGHSTLVPSAHEGVEISKEEYLKHVPARNVPAEYLK